MPIETRGLVEALLANVAKVRLLICVLFSMQNNRISVGKPENEILIR